MPKCCICGDIILGNVFTLGFSSMGKEWKETYCEHCYTMERDSAPIPCSGECQKCVQTLRRDESSGCCLLN